MKRQLPPVASEGVILLVLAPDRTVMVRYYNPVTGRYISRDPLGYPDGLNNYLYVHNNPINRIDPLGLWDWFGVLDTVLGAAESAGNAVYGAVDSLSMGLSSKVTTAVYGKETTAEIQNSTSYKVGATIEQVAETATGAAGLAKAAAKYGAKAVISQVAKSELKGVVVDKGVDALVDAGVIDEDAAGMAKAMANGIGSGKGATKAQSGVTAKTGTAKIPEGSADNPVLVRRGTDRESATRLGKQAQAAEQAGTAKNGEPYGHGVSVTTPESNAKLARDPNDASYSTKKDLEDAGFEVRHTPTSADPNHHTVQLPKPVTNKDADKFNDAFGR